MAADTLIGMALILLGGILSGLFTAPFSYIRGGVAATKNNSQVDHSTDSHSPLLPLRPLTV